jgi:hypothetical protein
VLVDFVEDLLPVALQVQDLQPLALVGELGPGPPAGLAGVVGLGVGEGEGLVEPPAAAVEVDQVAGEGRGRAVVVLGGGGVQELAEEGFALVGVQPREGPGVGAA